MSEGGNAIDAAVCMGFLTAVVEPSEASIAGSGFMLVHDAPSAESWSVEFPPRAPRAAQAEMFDPVEPFGAESLMAVGAVRDDANLRGPRAPCAPGVVAGLCLAHERFGTAPLSRLMAPAIELAESGFEVDEYLTLQMVVHMRALEASGEAGRIFLNGGLPRKANFACPTAASNPPRLRQADLARTLRTIATDGRDGFYRGPVARAIETAFSAAGGLVTRADLENYHATIERPLRRPYRGWCVLGPNSPSGAWTVLQALQILGRFDLNGLERGSAARLHLVSEALRHAFADRYDYAGDPDFDPVPLEGLLSEPYAREVARRVTSDRVAPVSQAIGDTGPARHGTAHFNAVDAQGRVVSCTITAGDTFGSKFVPKGSGALFDSGMAWFHPRPGKPNSIAPGKRPLVNMSPLLLLRDGQACAALGAAGGRRIISAVTQVIMSIVDDGQPLQDAISSPRLDASDRPLRLSDRFPIEVAEALRRLGHDVVPVREEHAPFSYELARPAAANVDAAGRRSGGIHPFATGFVAGR